MIEEGKTYKIKKLKGFEADGQEFTLDSEKNYAKIIKIVNSPNAKLGKIALCDIDGERYIIPVSEFVDPEDPKEYSDITLTKLESVIRPMSVNFWKELVEEATCASLGAAPCPAMGQITGGNVSGCLVNGVPVAGKSVKKKKKSKKNEEIVPNLFIPNGYTDEYTEKTEVSVTPEEMIDLVGETFDPATILTTIVKNSREIIKISVQYDTTIPGWLHVLKLEFLDIDEETVIDEIIEEDLTIEDCKDELIYLFSTHEAIDGGLYENVESIINELLNENFFEEYENITDLIAKQLDRLNFEYANTEDIIYKKEGEYKYLIKFDNGTGILKFKVSKNQDIIEEKEYQLENEEDVEKAFQEIEDVYRSNGL